MIKEIRLSCTDFHESLHYQISRNSAQWETIRYIRTDRKTDGRKDTLQLTAAFREYANLPIEDLVF